MATAPFGADLSRILVVDCAAPDGAACPGYWDEPQKVFLNWWDQALPEIAKRRLVCGEFAAAGRDAVFRWAPARAFFAWLNLPGTQGLCRHQMNARIVTVAMECHVRHGWMCNRGRRVQAVAESARAHHGAVFEVVIETARTLATEADAVKFARFAFGSTTHLHKLIGQVFVALDQRAFDDWEGRAKRRMTAVGLHAPRDENGRTNLTALARLDPGRDVDPQPQATDPSVALRAALIEAAVAAQRGEPYVVEQ